MLTWSHKIPFCHWSISMVLNAFHRTSRPRSRELQRLVSVSSRIKWTTSRSQSRVSV